MSTAEGVFRNATVADAPVLVDLIRSAYRGQASEQGWTSEAEFVGGDRIDESGVCEVILAPGSMMLFLTDGMRVVACCRLQDRAAASSISGPSQWTRACRHAAWAAGSWPRRSGSRRPDTGRPGCQYLYWIDKLS